MPEIKVNEHTESSQGIKDAAHLPRTLMGGTRGMRDAGETYLPQWPLETVQAWEARRDSTFLFNAYKRAWMSLVGKAFGKPTTLEDDVPDQIRDWSENIDLAGQHFDVFAQQVFGDSIHPGIGHILVDFPRSDGGITLADQRVSGARPYWVYVPAENILGWWSERILGVETLRMVRILQSTLEPYGSWGTAEVERVRVLYAGDPRVEDDTGFARFEVYRVQRDADPVLEDQGIMRPLREIPLSTFYARRTGFMDGRPALENLAWLNLEHWQSSSDQRNILHFARVPFYHFAGFTQEEFNSIKSLGSGTRTYSNNPEAHVDVVEHQGAAIGAGEDDLKRLKEEMEILSLEPLMNRPGQITATARTLDEARANASLLAWVRNFEDALEVALGFTATWTGLETGGSVKTNRDFGISLEQQENAKVLIDMRRAVPPLISASSFWRQMQVLGIAPDDRAWEEEEAEISAEGPPLADLGEEAEVRAE